MEEGKQRWEPRAPELSYSHFMTDIVLFSASLPPNVDKKGLQLATAAAAANNDGDDDSLDTDLYSKIPDSISPLRPEVFNQFHFHLLSYTDHLVMRFQRIQAL